MFSLPLSGRAIFASGLGAVLFSFVLVALWSVTALAARTWYPVSASHIIRFADSSKLTESLDPYQSPQQVRASVAIINEGTGAVTNPHFIARLTDPKGNEVNTVQVSSAATTIQPLQTSWFLLTFKLTQPIRKPTYVLSGVLEAGGPGTVPATRPLELTADRTLAAYEGITLTGGVASFLELFRLRSLATSIVVISFIVALIFMIARLTWRVWSSLWTGGHFRSRMIGTSGWDFSSSWASTLTAVGALIGTILSAGVIPDVPDHLSKPAYAGLER